MAELDARGGQMWGRSISITKYSREEQICKGHGWWSPRPNIGDTVLIPSKAGYMRLEFTTMEHTRDPDDMFFFDAVPIALEDPDDDNSVSS